MLHEFASEAEATALLALADGLLDRVALHAVGRDGRLCGLPWAVRLDTLGFHSLALLAVSIIPLVVLFLSDLIIGISMINLFVYTGFLAIVFLGTKIKSIKFRNIILSSFIFCSVLVFSLT